MKQLVFDKAAFFLELFQCGWSHQKTITAKTGTNLAGLKCLQLLFFTGPMTFLTFPELPTNSGRKRCHTVYAGSLTPLPATLAKHHPTKKHSGLMPLSNLHLVAFNNISLYCYGI